jgi:hypothetical protein
VTHLVDRLQESRPVAPLYARVLRLRHLEPGKLACALFFEGSIGLALLLAFTDLVSWYGVLALPVTVAAMVKLNDAVAGRLPDPHIPRRPARPREPAPASDSQPDDVDTAVLGFIPVRPRPFQDEAQ